jgi:DNA-binding transcriptional ArsR family regulator
VSRDFLKLDRVIHERGRLAIMSLLAAGGTLSFTELRDRLDMTDGNLSRHLATLQDAGLILLDRRVGSGRPQTDVSLTDRGRKAFAGYVERLEAILAPARSREGDLQEEDDDPVLTPA